MFRKILLILTLVVVLMMSFTLFLTGPPVLAVIPPIAAVTACICIKCSLIKLTGGKSAPMLCGQSASLTVSYSLFSVKLFELRRNVLKIPLIINVSLASFIMDSFRYAFVAGSRFLTTRLII